MAEETFEMVKPYLLAHEGGYVDHPRDPGGATNFGITIGTLSNWRGRKVSKREVKELTREEAMQIYKAQYWNTIRADELPMGVDYCCYDYSVNSGPSRSAKELQRVVGASVDGVVGLETLGRIRECGKTPSEIVNEICDRRLRFMQRLDTWPTFGTGWSRRVADVRSKATALARKSPQWQPDEPVITDVPTPKAKPEDKKKMDTALKPESWLPYVGGLQGFLSYFAENEVLQWALLAGMVAAIGIGSYYIIRRIRRDDD